MCDEKNNIPPQMTNSVEVEAVGESELVQAVSTALP
jgi:hypothetical protein